MQRLLGIWGTTPGATPRGACTAPVLRLAELPGKAVHVAAASAGAEGPRPARVFPAILLRRHVVSPHSQSATRRVHDCSLLSHTDVRMSHGETGSALVFRMRSEPCTALCTWAPGRVDRVPVMMYSVAKYCNSSHTSQESLDAKEIHSEKDF